MVMDNYILHKVRWQLGMLLFSAKLLLISTSYLNFLSDLILNPKRNSFLNMGVVSWCIIDTVVSWCITNSEKQQSLSLWVLDKWLHGPLSALKEFLFFANFPS